MTARDMVRKANKDAERDQAKSAYVTEERFKELFNHFSELFPDIEPVFIACHARTKKPRIKWTKVDKADWNNEEYFNALLHSVEEHGNIAIRLGEISGKLVTVDFDSVDHVEPFLAANPDFRNTLERGAREARSSGSLPRTIIPRRCAKWKSTAPRRTLGNFAEDVVSARFGVCTKTVTCTAE